MKDRPALSMINEAELAGGALRRGGGGEGRGRGQPIHTLGEIGQSNNVIVLVAANVIFCNIYYNIRCDAVIHPGDTLS